MLVNGQWTEDWQPVQESDDDGRFIRQAAGFRHTVSTDNDQGFTPESGRYHLYLAYICPWACRTLIALRLKGLDRHISHDIVDPRLTAQGWCFGDSFDGATGDTVNHARYMHEIYTRADPHYTGRATVPVLWDRKRATIVNNESSEILRILNRGFGDLADERIDLYPAALADEIDRVNERLYDRFNNGVYRAGFATTQQAYDEAVTEVFEALDWLEARLAGQTWLAGAQLTEADIRAFVTLIRFDPAYHGAFKCNLRPLSAYPALIDYVKRLLAIPAFAASVRIDHIQAGYYGIKAINPSGIVPAGPELDYIESMSPRAA
ncbi:glutathione S-transferase family protein [Nitrogeniibacter mangrovi]|uniref:Glutathione S-transferase family protein n=1 Tax=Nitrogeniibacter mangrovi TaxID=2016596 RepID=A0A6C1B2X6_9RHOO|nr:glutathione S-transferase C-terminal domain-containing protein [Nitrogeniibacter mangrovi]QID17986.1 glutathione S-transferase family protein [Nitrogeniibacter mangrovi]